MSAPRYLALASLLVASVLQRVAHSQSAASCPLVPLSTLSTTCYGACVEGQLCMAGATSTAACACFTALNPFDRFALLIPFNMTTQAKLLVSPPLALDTVPASGIEIAIGQDVSVSNDQVTKIDQWTLPSNVTMVFIVGGSSIDAIFKNFVASVDIATKFLDGQTQIKLLHFKNLQLKTPMATMAAYFPPNIVELVLINMFLSGFPAPIFKLRKLENLSMGYNGLVEITPSDSMPNLIKLRLNRNTFEKFPEAIFTHSKLKELYIHDNSRLQNVSFTLNQSMFLDALDVFMIDQASLQQGCPSSYLCKNGLLLCIAGANIKATSDGSSASSSLPSDTNYNGAGRTSISDTKDSSSSNNTAVIIGCVGGGVVVVGIIAAFFVARSRKVHAKPSTDSLTGPSMQNPSNGGGSGGGGNRGSEQPSGSLWNDQDLLALKVSVEDIQEVKKIGNGAFADVWLVKFCKSQLLASKRLRRDAVTRERTQAFIAEIKLVSSLKHPNIVEFMGAAWVRETDLQALFEYMDNGDLRTYLMNPGIPTQWSSDKLQIAIDVAEALVYVHSFMPPLVHRDLKSRNVLLNSEMQAKLTDFGVSRYRSDQNTMTAGVGTGRWLAPEVISGDGSYGTAADMFSFGVILSELDSHQIPYQEVRGANGNQLADVALLQMISTGELKPMMSRACPDKIAELANRCFKLNPDDRPNAVEVAYILRTFKKSLTSFYM